MRKISLILLAVLFISINAFADYCITRGPDIGAIYFIGPTATGEGIYRSTDFGETAVCVDSTANAMSICADKTPGVLYYFAMPENLYYSNNYGQQGSWVFRNSGMHIGSNSGRNEGEIYDSFSKHSEDYGVNFITHTANGFFGSRKGVEIDNQDSVGYVTVTIYSIPDSIYLLITYDNFENLQIHKVLNYDQQNGFNISRGVLEGENFIIDSYFNLFYSTDYCYTWLKKNEFNFCEFYRFGSVGGRQEGEYYMMLTFINMMGENKHTYIFHSIDYGVTFDVFHPFSKGEEPLLSNFSTTTTEGTLPLEVQFCNYSIGDIQSYEWDFNNDGVIDSYEEEPEYTYEDTGYYSVKLTIYDSDESNEFLRENYIHVTNPNAVDEETNHSGIILNNKPNPFKISTKISYNLPQNIREAEIEIYNIKGKLIETISVDSESNSVDWYSKNLSSGIYFYRLNLKNSPVKKIIIIK